MTDGVCQKIKDSLLELNMGGTIEQVNLVVNGEAVVQEAVDAVAQALEVVGKRFQSGEWFLAELVYSGEIAKAAMELLGPLMKGDSTELLGKIVVGTVAGDLHDLGKNIFINYSKSAGFEVVDLGVDVSAAKFADAVKEHSPLALGMSCLLTVTADEIGKVIAELERQGIRDQSRIIIGGAALTEQFADEVKADAFAPDAITGTDIVKEWSAA